jgi:uncharacterized membrane protein
MITRKKATITGLGTALMAGAVFVAWRKSAKQRAKLADWKKGKIENMYYNTLDERNIPHG